MNLHRHRRCATCRRQIRVSKLSKDTGECQSCYGQTLIVARACKESPLESFRRRDIRKERTPFYMVDLPEETYTLLEKERAQCITHLRRDYQGEDEQFYFPSHHPGAKQAFIEALCRAMERSNQHPAHIHAVRTTGKIIHDRNFRHVPDEWTAAWMEAVQQYAKWAPSMDTSKADLDLAGRT